MNEIRKKLINFFEKIKSVIRLISNKLATDSGKADKIFTIISVIIFFIVFVFVFRLVNPRIIELMEEKRTGIIKRDDHGCLRFEGYIWCESKRKCISNQEEECHLSREQKEKFVKDFLNKNIKNVILTESIRGDFIIKDFEFDDDMSNKVYVNLENKIFSYKARMLFSIHSDGGVDISDFEIVDKKKHVIIP